MKHRKVLLFIIIAYGITWAVLFGLEQIMNDQDGFVGVLLTFLYRWGPALSAIIVSRRVYRDPLSQLGITPKDQIRTPWFFFGLAWVVILMIGTMILTSLLGNLAGMDIVGNINFDTDRVLRHMTPQGMDSADIPEWFQSLNSGVLFALMVLFQFLLGTTLYVAYTYGEELGWRGFLLQETKALGFWKGNLITGLFSGIWYLALFFQESDNEAWTSVNMVVMVLFYISLAYPMAYFARKSGSILTAACMVGVLMALAGVLGLFIVSDQYFLTGMTGPVGIVLCWVTTGVITWKDPHFLEAFRDWPYPV